MQQNTSNVIDFKVALKARANRAEAGSSSYNRAKAKAAHMGLVLAPRTSADQAAADFRSRLRAWGAGGDRAIEAEIVRQRLRDAAN